MQTEELMQQVRRLEIITRHAVTEVFAGEYSSAFKGRGMEFAEVREYQPGDDIRSIDWNVTARAGVPYIKRFDEERELTVLLAADLSGSGQFGTVDRTKKQLAIEICALMAFAALRKNDRVGLIAFTDDVELFIPPRKGSKHTLRVLRELIAFEPQRPQTDLACVADHIASTVKKSAIVFVVSDYLVGAAGETAYEEPMRRLAARHDVIAVQTTDPREEELPRAGLMTLRDAETGRRTLVDTSSRRVRRAHAARAHQHDEQLRSAMIKLGVDHVRVSTGASYVDALARLFRQRERRR